jgi:hypothetical protein
MNDEEVLAAARASLTQARESLGQVRMDRPVAAVVARARSRRRRQALSGGAAVGAVAAIAVLLAAAGLPGSSPARPAASGSTSGARTTAYVVKRVEDALAHNRMVFHGTSYSQGSRTVTWAYGNRNRFEEFTGKQCGHANRKGWCTHHRGPERYLSDGTTLVHGKLMDAYVTYFDRRYSLSKVWNSPPNACSPRASMEVGGPGVPTGDWPAFLRATIACGAARVTGHVLINGVETTKISGKPVTVKLQPGYAKVIHEKWARNYWTLYVDPATYLPVRMSGSTYMFGGPMKAYTSSSVTNVRWLPATRANTAKALVTIPPGFHLWRGSAGDQ